jgi:AcrR family transcriptional regulator
VALALMSEHGSADTSMRTLATACGLNVATLYHYFPSKAELLRSVIEERGYFQLLAADPPAVEADRPLRPRLEGFLTALSASARAEEAPVRLLLGEGLRQEPTAAATVVDLLAALDAAFARWLEEGFADLGGDPRATARVLRHLLVARLVEGLAVAGPPEDDATWAREVTAVLLG